MCSEPSGWLPVEIRLDTRLPHLINTATVKWMKLTGVSFSEPFYGQTIMRARSADARLMEIETGLHAISRAARAQPHCKPAGLIFHISRCGSTLLSNCLRSATDTLVLSEAHPIVSLTRPYLRSCGSLAESRWEATRANLLSSTVTLFAHYAHERNIRVILKFMSLNILSLQFVRSLWPSVPCVVVVRNPIEVLAANCVGGGWMSAKALDDLGSLLAGVSVSESSAVRTMRDEEFGARVIGNYLNAALDSINELSAVIDYEEINPDMVMRLCRLFELEPAGILRDLERNFVHYSKDPNLRIHIDDRARKQCSLGNDARTSISRWAEPQYRQLLERRPVRW
jgi:hypothetical protein